METQKLIIGSRSYDVAKREKLDTRAANLAYLQAAASINLSNDALFIRRLPMKFQALNPDHPEEGYISHDDPDANELWHVRGCSFPQSVILATEILECPSSTNFVAASFKREEILIFLKTLRGHENITLEYVSEDLLGFRFVGNYAYCNKEQFDKLMDFNEQTFKRDKDLDSRTWLWSNFSKKGKFSIGVA